MALFQKGHPGGPGRPKGGQITWCREFADGEGKQILLRWARQKKYGKVAMDALKTIYAYGYGRPAESIDLTSNGERIGLIEAIQSGRKRAGL